MRSLPVVLGFGLSVALVACGSEPTRPPRTASAKPVQRPPTPQVVQNDGLSQEQIVSVVEARYPAVRGCHTMQYGGSGSAVGGTMIVDMEISPEGSVTSATVSDSSFESSELEECVLDVTRSLQFPTSTAGTEFSWKFRFRAPG